MDKCKIETSDEKKFCSVHDMDAICKHRCLTNPCNCPQYKKAISIKNDFGGGDDNGEPDSMAGDDNLGGVDDEGDFGEKDTSSADLFIVALTVNGITYEEKGQTIVKALNKIVPGQLKTRGRWKVSKNGKSFERNMPAPLVKRLFVNKISQEIFQKQMSNMLR